jgi:hypothetical protein
MIALTKIIFALVVMCVAGLVEFSSAGRAESAATTAPQNAAVQPAALAILKAMSDRLAAAEKMSFDVKGAFDVPASNGQPLFYMTRSQVTLERPDKMRVVTEDDGPREEFTYDGKQMAVFMPDTNMAAIGDAPASLDAMLAKAYVEAGLYFPFVDIIVSDPYASFSRALLSAFVIGQSMLVGNTKTDVIALADGRVQWQIWIGAEDKLPRLIWSTATGMPEKPRVMVEFTNWKLGDEVEAEESDFAAPSGATVIEFARPDAQ